MKIALLCKFDQLLTSCQYAHRPYPSCGHHNYMRISARSHKIARSRFMVRIEDARILQLCCLYRLVTWYLLLNVPIDQDLLRLSTQWCWKNWTCAILKIHCAIAKTKVLVKDLDWWLLKCCMLNPRWMSIPRLQFMTFLDYFLNKSDYIKRRGLTLYRSGVGVCYIQRQQTPRPRELVTQRVAVGLQKCAPNIETQTLARPS